MMKLPGNNRLDLKRICNQMCYYLAFITCFHHRDKAIYRAWRGIVYICNQPLSESPGDAACFARAMWERHVFSPRCNNIPSCNHVDPGEKNVDFAYQGFNHVDPGEKNVDFAYQGFFHASREMMGCLLEQICTESASTFGWRQERKQLLKEIEVIRSRLDELEMKRVRLWRNSQYPMFF